MRKKVKALLRREGGLDEEEINQNRRMCERCVVKERKRKRSSQNVERDRQLSLVRERESEEKTVSLTLSIKFHKLKWYYLEIFKG